jgi:homoserine kinase type II
VLPSLGVAFLTALSRDDAQRIGADFGLSVTGIQPFAGGSVNSNFALECGTERFFLRIYEEQAREGALAELGLVSELARAGVKTPAPLRRPNGELLAEQSGKPVAIFPWIDGEWLCQSRVTAARCKKLGAALAAVHLAGAEIASEGRFVPAALGARLERIERESTEYLADVAYIRERLAHHVARRDPSLPEGLIHGDLFRDNVLWKGEELVALIDFESASRGPFVYDLMVCVHAWCYGDRFEPELVVALFEGYRAKRALSPAELAAIPVEGALGALRFAITRITDYAMRAPPGTPPLRDYRRFLQRLAALEAGEPMPAAIFV